MSILQEYEQIRKEIGEKEYALIEQFLNEHPELFLSDVYYKKEIHDQFEAWKSQRVPLVDLYDINMCIQGKKGLDIDDIKEQISICLHNICVTVMFPDERKYTDGEINDFYGKKVKGRCVYFKGLEDCTLNNDPDDPGDCVYEGGIEPENPAAKCKWYKESKGETT